MTVSYPFDANALVDEVTAGIYEEFPELLERYGERGKVKCREDVFYHLEHLQIAFNMKQDKLFVDYAIWLDGLLRSRGMTTAHVVDSFSRIERAMAGKLPGDLQAGFAHLLQLAVKTLLEKAEKTGE
ncbi:hypothetical protein JJB07_16570 [Tumebacillus sp. ITR2]|uniref:Uncharacterized protein n=1 Tax=Tumebacillus amylolyticus TaxID=2801339 RepID=A0ABS1JDB6_9BACL|nr:hypothetical protein [Tumebacillus amylolyticus]MBL0388229.1 hypothetical protein [Tumebacillus amylolyticus]